MQFFIQTSHEIWQQNSSQYPGKGIRKKKSPSSETDISFHNQWEIRPNRFGHDIKISFKLI